VRVNETGCRPRIEPEYLTFWLNSDVAQRTIKRIATPAIGQANLNPTEFQKYCLIPVPPKPQRLRIGSILQTWDQAIIKQRRLIAAKESEREYYVSEHLSSSHWNAAPIGAVIAAVSRPIPTPKTAYMALGIRSHGKGTFQRLIERPDEIDMETVYSVGSEDLIANITFAWEGAVALARPEDAGCYVSHRFPTFAVDTQKVNRDFLGYVIGTRRFFYDLSIASPGGAGRNRVLNKKDFLKIEIPLPPRRSQDQIANFLKALDLEIDLLSKQLALLEKQNRALTRKLLTGELLVSVADDASHAGTMLPCEEAAQ
jgi:type I restriction enzyme S subunit